MTLPPLLLSLALSAAGACAHCAPPARAAGPAASAPARAAAPARHAASAACPARRLGASGAVGRATSKVRHIPDEDDPCAESSGVARPPPR